MRNQVQVTFRHVLPSDAVRDVVEERFERMCRHLPVGTSCHVTLARTGRGRCICARVEIHGAGVRVCSEGRSADTDRAVRKAFARAGAHSHDRRPNELRSHRLPRRADHAWAIAGASH